MGFGRLGWPRKRRVISPCDMPPLRREGPALYPAAQDKCCDLAPLPDELGSLPGIIQDSVMKGLQRGLREMPPLNVVRAPHESPPFRSRSLNETVRLIIESDSNPGTLSLIQALIGNTSSTPGVALDIVVASGAAASPNDLIPFLVIEGDSFKRNHISGVDIIPSTLDAVDVCAFTVLVDGATVLDRVSLLDLMDFSLDALPSRRIEFFVQIRDPAALFFMYFAVKGWTYPCQDQGDFLSDATLQEDGHWEAPNAPCVPPRRGRGGRCE